MYSPKISESLVHQLYQEAKNQNKPMTRLVNEIIEKHLSERKESEIGLQSDNSRRHNPDNLGKGQG
jgi:hypothetical protein